MENNTLALILKQLLKNNFGKVFAKGESVTFKENTFYVYNNQTYPKNGHFIGLFYKRKVLYIFDSLSLNKIPLYLLKKVNHVIPIVKKRLQSKYTQICGLYVIYFCCKLYEGYTFKQIMKPFSNFVDRNDTLIFNWYRSNNHFFGKYKKLYMLNSPHINKTLKTICTKNILKI